MRQHAWIILATAGSMFSGIGSLLCWNPTAPTTCAAEDEPFQLTSDLTYSQLKNTLKFFYYDYRMKESVSNLQASIRANLDRIHARPRLLEGSKLPKDDSKTVHV